jgi:uncharacterized membrane protein YhaH (DUF805 family)
MEPFASYLSASGRIAPKPFALGVVVVYGLSFLSQVLISPPMMVRGGIYAFAIVQIALIWAWYALHARRLRDAARPIGLALAIAVLYALAIVLLTLVVEPILGPDASTVGVQARRTGFPDLWVFLLLFAALTGQPDLGFFYILAVGILALIFAPIVLAIGFSIWTGTRPSAVRAPEASG